MKKIVDNDLCGWVLELGKIEFELAHTWQKGLVKMRKEGMARDTIIFVEHPPVITVGKDGHEDNYKDLDPAPIKIERGGDVTYHGPGQLVIYFIFNLNRRGKDLHDFMNKVQAGMINALGKFKIDAKKGEKYTGVWVGEKKIASIGIAVKNWITFHGAALNLNTDLSEFKAINPCGLDAETMVSVNKLLNKKVDMKAMQKVLLEEYSKIFDTVFYPIKLDGLAEDIESQAGGYTI